MSSLIVRPATQSDIPAIVDIYTYYVTDTVITYEETVPDITEMTRRFEATLKLGMPYLVAQVDGVVQGYAYGGAFRERIAYRYCVEHAIYLSKDVKGQGIGSLLMEHLLTELEAAGIRQVIAVIGDLTNHASVALHSKFGFEKVGILPASGYKFNRWIDTILMQRSLGAGAQTPPVGDGLNLRAK
ncbi:GNAT family N-acetyltransferase [Terasakiella pusilla]|uniref:GNAT family N-acetyltransferase n=1 Tax=Terasakiella pusilla TaxID=64973 RepID=UPI00048CFD37|nr:GNAT family N-acetyltransferase [Terasakiella pusilla]